MSEPRSTETRPAGLADLPGIAELERATFGDVVYPDFFFRQAFDLWKEWLFVATDDRGKVRGYVLGAPSFNSGEAWLLSLAVHQSARGHGVGRALTEGLLEAMRAKNVSAVRLTVRPDNPALALYRSLGFREVETEPHYFHANDPRMVMKLMLQQAYVQSF